MSTPLEWLEALRISTQEPQSLEDLKVFKKSILEALGFEGASWAAILIEIKRLKTIELKQRWGLDE